MIFKIKDFAIVIMGQSPSSDILVDEYQVNYLPFIGGGAEIGNLFPKSKRFCPDFITSKVKDGDIIISARAPVGKTNIADKEYILGRGACAVSLVSIPKELAWYFYEAIRIKLEMSCSGTGTTFDGISKADVENIEFNLPVNDDGSIDEALIAEMSIEFDNLDDSFRKTLSLLKQKLHHLDEYKTALIHNAVTKGLDAKGCRILDGTPVSEMKWKDSGVEWIGDVPDGWDVLPSKYIMKFVSGNAVSAPMLNKEGEGVRYLRTSDVYERISVNKDNVYVNELDSRSVIKQKEDYIVCFDGYNNILGHGTLGLVTNNGEGVISGELNKISARDEHKKFFEFFMASSYIGNEIVANSRGATVYHAGHIKKQLKVLLPQSNEINAIVEYLESRASSLDAAKQAINKKIALLVEYKKSLINEAVSGQ